MVDGFQSTWGPQDDFDDQRTIDVESPNNSNHLKIPQPSKLSRWYVDV